MENKNNLPIESKKGIWDEIKRKFEKIVSFLKKDTKEELIKEEVYSIKQNQVESKNKVEMSKSENPIIENAKMAFKNYILNTNHEITNNVYELIKERLIANEDTIKALIKIKDSGVSFLEILEMLDEEKGEIEEFKKSIFTKKLDDKFIFSQYQVPVGLICVFSNDVKEIIRHIYKAVATRNAIIVVQKDYEEHSVQNLVLLIVKEALKKMKIDENIIQIVDSTKIKEEDINKFDLIIGKDNISNKKEDTDEVYIYEEDEFFASIVKEEMAKLSLSGKNPRLIKGDLENAINEVNKTNSYSVCIYTKDRKKGYEFINRVNSKNVFFNTTLQNASKIEKSNNVYFKMKNIALEYTF